MINLIEKTISLRGKTYPIETIEVWWGTPVGLFTELDEAIKKCQELDLDPNLMIKPLPVALAENGNVYEPFP